VSDPAYLQLDGLSRRFGEVRAVDDVSLALGRGEVLALLGPSGSGKTTVLRLLAGFEQPDSGRVLLEGRDLTRLTPAARRIGMVFQHYALFPHLDVGQNVAFGLESQRVPSAEIPGRVADALALVDLAGTERRRVTQLSGGQQQRVALARALAPEPRILLLDEPLSNLDPALRVRTRRELAELIRRIGITTVFVTHEQDEAYDLGDRIALLRNGRLQQVGAAEELYRSPASPFVAQFIGQSTAVPVDVQSIDGGVATVSAGGGTWRVPAGAATGRGDAVLHVRPDAVYLAPSGAGEVMGTVKERRFAGQAWLYTVQLDGGPELEVRGPADAASPGARTAILVTRRNEGGLHLFPAGDE
jgi:ABC-type Fe3+/spermidine/putrescine transport system ATPase subunit